MSSFPGNGIWEMHRGQLAETNRFFFLLNQFSLG
jgi:hypothetical protein